MKKIIFTIFQLLISTILFSQNYVNREWSATTANVMALDWTKNILTTNNELIKVGNTLVSGQGADILTIKYAEDGVILWQNVFNTASANNDYGVSLTEDANGDVIVVGTTDNSVTNNNDIVILKISATGTLIWSQTFNNTYNKNDVAIDVKTDINGNIYIAAGTELTITNTDYLLLKLNAAGVVQWTSQYDFASLMEIPQAIDFDYAGNIFITGASASSALNWDFTIAIFSTSGTFLSDERSSFFGNGYDLPTSYKKDAIGNIYVTGKTSANGIDYDIRTIKLDAQFNLLWSKTINVCNREDVGNSIDVDASGDVYVGGFVTNCNNRKEIIIVKYDALGNEIWRHQQLSKDATGNALIKMVAINNQADLYAIGEEKGSNGSTNTVLLKLESNGRLDWKRESGSIPDEKAVGLNVTTDGRVYINSIKDGTIDNYVSEFYSDYQLNSNVILNNAGKPFCKKNELIIKFKQSALNINNIDNSANTKIADFGGIDFWLTPSAIIAFNNALSGICSNNFSNSNTSIDNPCGIDAVRIFRNLKSTDNTALNRLNEIVKVPDFWATLLVVFPNDMDILIIRDALKNIPSVVEYIDINMLAVTQATANDSLYPLQHGLHNTGIFPKANINIEKAWDIVPNGGSPTVKCGVFDSGINWWHPEFGYNGYNPASSKVADGWDFYTLQKTKSTTIPNYLSHGSAMASIMGAVRNNTKGIAGVAGGNANGDSTIIDKGMALYDLKIVAANSGTFAENNLAYIMDAMTESAKNPAVGYNYRFGLHLMNNSWKLESAIPDYFNDTNFTFLREGVHFVNRMNIAFLACRGNYGTNQETYPAIIDDDWVMNVGGVGVDGCWAQLSNSFNTSAANYGLDVDFAGTMADTLNLAIAIIGPAANFGGTSSATAQVSGVVGLMMSYINTPSASYQNLAPEDCEHILELSATDDTCNIGSDIYIGAGLINAGKALQLIEKPFNAVNHFGTNFLSSFTKSVTSGYFTQSVFLKENYKDQNTNIQLRGHYNIQPYRIEAEVNHNLVNSDSIVGYWPRNSSSTPWALFDGGGLSPRERIKITYLDQNICKMTGFVYQIFDASNNSVGWWPMDTTLSNLTFEYTILTHNILKPTAIDNQTVTTNNIASLYPNPTSNAHVLEIKTNSKELLTINLFDYQGKKLATIYNQIPNNSLLKLEQNVSNLPNSIYSYQIIQGCNSTHLQFIKN
jgi:hypothetical protein